MSSACQQSAQKFFFEFLQGLSNERYSVFETILNSTNNPKSEADICQARLADQLQYAYKTVKRALKEFTDLGMIKKETIVIRGRNKTTRVRLTDFFSHPHVRAILYKVFGTAPQFVISIKSFLSATVPTVLSLKTKKDIQVQSSLIDVYQSLNPAGSSYNCKSEPQKKVGVSMKLDEISIRKCLAIEAALIERGERLGQMDTAKLTAFSDACLDYASKQMRHSRPKLPFNYYLSLCFQWCKDNNSEPQWPIADFIREQDLLSKYRPSVNDSIKQTLANRQETGKQESTYAAECAERAEKQKRVDEKSKANLEAHMARRGYKTLTAEERSKVDLTNPFMITVIDAQIKALANCDTDSEHAKGIRKNLADWGITL